jgi:hypothetical protein
MSDVRESIVLCEGFDDRAFWQGLLLSLGCKDARRDSSIHKFNAVFTYRTPSGRLVHVVPCHQQQSAVGSEERAQDPVRFLARLLLKGRATKPLSRLILNLDVDTSNPSDIVASIRSIVGPEARETPSSDFELDDGQLVVSPLLWYLPRPVATGIPAQQALERLVCAALCDAFPERGLAVGSWLSSRPDPRGKEHKAHAWSFMAGWHTDHGMGDFYASLWRDPDIQPKLRAILERTSAWPTIVALVGT